jgi:hypothetical protein
MLCALGTKPELTASYAAVCSADISARLLALLGIPRISPCSHACYKASKVGGRFRV